MVAVKFPTVYDTLGVDPSVSDLDLKKAYRRRARQTHPDHSGNDSAAEFDAVQQAWEQVQTPEKRATYDLHLRFISPMPRPTGSSRATSPSPREPRHDDWASPAAQAWRREEQFRAKMRAMDDDFRRQREAERIRDEYRTKWAAERTARETKTTEQAARAKKVGIFIIDDEGITMMVPVMPKGYRLGAALVFTVVTLIGLGTFTLTGLLSGWMLVGASIVGLILAMRISLGTWYVPGMDKTAGHRVVGATATGFGLCLITLLASFIW